MKKSGKGNEQQSKSPVEQGFYFPAEWEKHDAIFLAWPHDITSFPDLPRAEKAYAEIISAMQKTKSETVKLFVTGKKMKERAEHIISGAGADVAKVRFYLHDYGDVWFRDFGPTFLINKNRKELAMVKWKFNAWGNKYAELLKDDILPNVINAEMQIKMFDSGIVGEGGSLEVNGSGTLLTTKSCLPNSNRNPGMGKYKIESILARSLGVSNIIWLEGGIQGDDTDGHIDNLARFVDAKTILCAYEDDEKGVNHKSLKGNYELLLGASDEKGRKFKVLKLPMPEIFSGNEALPASYANFYIANNAILIPQFGHENDSKAFSIIKKCFPGRKAMGIDCTEIVQGNGTLHCISQQQPKP
jgi:agmatine deiminase